MSKLYFTLVCGVVLYSCSYQKEVEVKEVKAPVNQVEQIKNSTKNSKEIDGVFEFVSETTSLAKPKKTYKKTDKEWRGLWIFKEGYFSRNMMKIHPQSLTNYRLPSKREDLEFDAVAGKFQIDDEGVIQIRKITAWHPVVLLKIESFHYEFEGDLLILTQFPHPEGRPFRHAVSRGKSVIVLRRLAKETGSRN